jgi:crotonobetaine/carnitine-CoA ligase
VLWAARANATHFGLTPEDRCLVFLPLFHAVALSWNFLGTLHSGGSVVLMQRFSATRFWDVAVTHGCTWANMVGFTLQAVSGLPDPPEHRFRTWVCAGDLQAVRSRWGIRTLGAFGMTEMVSQPLSSDLHLPGPEGSVGRPNPGYRVDLRREDGLPPSPGEVATLWIKGLPGVTIFQGYLHDPQATSKAFDTDGWFCTGDQVIATPDGHAFYAGRTKDMLKVGAENVAAIEIEEVILQVAGVREAAVVGLPDRMLDEVPVAFLVIEGQTDETLAAIHARCLERLADFKRPRSLHVVDELPKGLLDKVLKRELRELAVRLAVPVNAPAERRR